MKIQSIAILVLLSFFLLSCGESLEIKKEDTKIPMEPVVLPEFSDIPKNGRLNVGSFYTVVPQYGTGDFTRKGDFNGDGKDDIISLAYNLAYLKLSQGQYPFLNETWLTDNRYGGSYYTFAGDFNGDGFSDITSAIGSSLYMKMNNKNRGFDFYTVTLSSELWPFLDRIFVFGNKFDGGWGDPGYNVVGDFNGDGKDDIGAFKGAKAYMKISTGSGFQNVIWPTDGIFGSPGFVFAMDYDGDGDDDIVSPAGNLIYVKVSNRSGFSNLTYYNQSNQFGLTYYTWAGDTNNNGKEELITAIGSTIIVREIGVSGSWENIYYYTQNFWGDRGYNFAMDQTGSDGDEIVSAFGNQIFVH
jgi:hypothetical protein